MGWAMSKLPWILLLAAVVGLVGREIVWRAEIDRIDELEQLLYDVCRSETVEAERHAMEQLADWTHEEGVTVIIGAYSLSDGQSMSLSIACFKL